jgi:quinolinate synthase
MPEKHAGCPLANMITAKKLRELKNQHPGAVTVGYVNTSAEVKAELDLCCTSANAVKVVASVPQDKAVIFVPDKYLASFVSRKLNRRLIMWNGFCPTHVKILPEDILREKRIHPKALVLVHPECTPEVIDLADEALSTSGMSKFVAQSQAKEFIIGTEIGMLYRLKSDNPDKNFYAASELAVCPNMKRTTIDKVLWSLEELKDEVRVSDEIRRRARRSIDAMLKIV